MDFEKSFDEILDAILTDYGNQFPEADTSKGTLIFIKAACLASALWGLYKYQGWIAKQGFPDTADTEALDHHAWVRGLTRTAGETDAAYLARLLDYIRKPPAGGNKSDYVKWALEISNVAAAYCTPLGNGLGTVDVVILGNKNTTGGEAPSANVRAGKITSVTAGKLKDSGANFTDASRPVRVGAVVRNTGKGLETSVASVDSATQLTLNADIFLYAGENYHVYFHSGTATSVATNKLIDTAANFYDAVYTLAGGDIVKNLDTGEQAALAGFSGPTQISLSADIFKNGGERYVIESLAARVKEYIDSVRPVTASAVRVLVPTFTQVAVTMFLSGSGANKAQTAADIAAYLASLIPGQPLYKSQLLAIAVDNGAENAVISLPAADIVPGTSEILRPGAIDVS